MREKNLWKWLRLVLPQGQYSRIESGDISPGFPDVDWQIGSYDQSFSGKFELKSAKDPNAEVPFPDEKTGLHRSQQLWIKEHVRFGGNVWIIAEVGKIVYVISGRNYRLFNGASRDKLVSLSRAILTKNQLQDSAGELLHLMTEKRYE